MWCGESSKSFRKGGEALGCGAERVPEAFGRVEKPSMWCGESSGRGSARARQHGVPSSQALERATGCARVYTAALGASVPHFHCHMVPVYEGKEGELGMPALSVTGQQGAWDVFFQASSRALKP